MKTQSLWKPLLVGLLAISCVEAKERDDREDDQRDSSHALNRNLEVGNNAREGNLSTVNGSISIGDHAEVKVAKTVNGAVMLGADSRAEKLETVNGKIEVGARSTVSGDVKTVNGRLNVSEEATILGNVKNVNGKLVLESRAHVAMQLVTVSGDITLEEKARVDGGIWVKKPNSQWDSSDSDHRTPTIKIGPGAEVRGELVFEYPVKLRVHSTAQIGPVRGAEIERF